VLKVQWLGGPGDGNWVELPDDADVLLTSAGKVPIRTAVILMDDGSTQEKLILDYYARE
jgi:hypothetical protein